MDSDVVSDDGPLAGVRVLDFTWVISGPQCTQVLADFGAEVLRVEWPHHPDGLRTRLCAPDADASSLEFSGLWNNLNRNKRSVTLNMRHPDGLAIARRLLAVCDIVVENFSPGVLGSWGLSWEEMQAINPRLIYLAMSGFGRGGPSEQHLVFAPLMQALSGLHAMTGAPASEPAGLGFSYADHVAGYYGALAALAALAERDSTGAGSMVDLGQVEASVTLTSSTLLDYQITGRPAVAWGNVPFGQPDAPAGLFRCAGDDAWCAISVRTPEHWQALVRVIGDDRLTDPRFDSARWRRAHRRYLDELIQDWTTPLERDEVVARLAAVGVPSTALLTVDEVVASSALRRHGYFESAPHEYLGEREFQMGAIRSSCGPRLRHAAPTMGEANEQVYRDLLQLPVEQIASLHDDGAI